MSVQGILGQSAVLSSIILSLACTPARSHSPSSYPSQSACQGRDRADRSPSSLTTALLLLNTHSPAAPNPLHSSTRPRSVSLNPRTPFVDSPCSCSSPDLLLLAPPRFGLLAVLLVIPCHPPRPYLAQSHRVPFSPDTLPLSTASRRSLTRAHTRMTPKSYRCYCSSYACQGQIWQRRTIMKHRLADLARCEEFRAVRQQVPKALLESLEWGKRCFDQQYEVRGPSFLLPSLPESLLDDADSASPCLPLPITRHVTDEPSDRPPSEEDLALRLGGRQDGRRRRVGKRSVVGFYESLP